MMSFEEEAEGDMDLRERECEIEHQKREETQMEETNKEAGFERELKALKLLRENDIGYNKVLKGLQESFAEKHKDMITSMAENLEAISKLEESIKTKALDEYAADESKNKKLPFGVGIRVMKEVLFDDDLAMGWAKQTGLCLKLDVSGFKKIAKAQDIDFVTIKDKPSATIPTEIKIE